MWLSDVKGSFTFITLFIIGLSAIIFLILLFVGNYFFNYALKRSDSWPEGGNRDIPSITPEKYQNIIDKRRELDKSRAIKWLSNSNHETVNIMSEDGLKLEASKFIQDKISHKYAIIIHGYSQIRSDVFDIAHEYYLREYNVIVPDLRGHGKSQGHYLGMGWRDREDILLWIKDVLSFDSISEIVLHGVSMGASAVMMVSGEKMPSNVKSIIEDCGYTSVFEIFKLELRVRFNLPAFPILNAAGVITKFRAGYKISEASAIKQVGKTSVPMMFIHGCYDNFVPAEMVYRLYDSCSSKKEILVMEEAGHNESRFLDHDKYYNSVFQFIDSCL